jgi:hypothetical protein
VGGTSVNIVWGELNVISVLTLVSQFALLAIFIARASDRAIRALSLSETNSTDIADIRRRKAALIAEFQGMKQDVKEVEDCARTCKDQVAIIQSSFSVYRESVAQNYVTNDALQRAENRIERLIDNLGKNIEKLIENRSAVHTR